MSDKNRKKRVNNTHEHNVEPDEEQESNGEGSMLDEALEESPEETESAEPEMKTPKINPVQDIELTIEEKLEKAEDALMRERASFINYRKRVEEEKGQIRRFGAQEMAYDLLTVLDYFEESLKFTSDDSEMSSVIMGVKFTVEELHRVLGKHGIKEIDTDIEFDPRFHEAFGTEENADADPDTILKVHRKGYMYKDRVLRPAMVTVARNPGAKNDDRN